MSKKRKKIKENKLLPVKKENQGLIVVEREKFKLAKIYEKKVFKKAVKTISLALVGTISVFYIMIMILATTSIFYVSHLKNGLIQKGVYVNGINISGMSTEEAMKNLSQELNGNIKDKIVLRYKENTYELNLKELELQFSIEAAVDEAYSIGRTKNVVKDLWEYAKVINDTMDITSELKYKEEFLEQFILQLASDLPDKVQEYSYHIENDLLIINRGKSGIELNQEELKNRILSNLNERKYEEEIEIPVYETLPKDIDLQVIHDEVFCQPQDAYVTNEPFEIHQQVIGKDFPIESAQNIINSSPESDRYEISLELTNPNVFVKDLNIFPDVLSSFGTNYVNNYNRTTNLILASSKISSTVLSPGEEFSFNDVVGERTIAKGYRNAAIFVDGKVEDGLAGGICQVSSTLYNAVVQANLQITERHNHSMLTSYLAGGKDATVVWGRYDFKFVNNREYPIKIEISVENGVITAVVYGIRSSQEFDINIESQYLGISGRYRVYNAYKVYRQNGVEVNREFLSRDLYK